MITYKHEGFIGKAIESVLAQRTNFPIELVIGDDHSPDRTAEIVGRYASTANVTIRARTHPRNLGPHQNFLATFGECQGTYIALLEGDDFWTDPEKLQRQVDFLEANPDFAICFHPADILRNGRIEPDTLTREVTMNTDIRDLALGNYMHTCTVVFRRGLFDKFPPSFTLAPAGDYFLHMLNAKRGRIHKLRQKMAVYRVHDGGMWSAQNDIDLKILTYLECMIGCFEPEIEEILKQRHREIGFKSFISRIDESNSPSRLERALRYGSTHFAEKIVPWVQQAKAFDEHRLFRFLKRFL